MRTTLSLVTALAALAALAFAGSALAAPGRGKAHAARGHGKAHAAVRYAFVGQLTAAPAGGSLSLTVTGGNRAARRAMISESTGQTFAYGDSTEFLTWSAGAPTVGQPGDLAAGDVVRVAVRAAAGASIADIEQTAAAVVSDRGSNPSKPTQPLYTFRGTLTAVGAGSVTLAVKNGDRRATMLLAGQSRSQTFTTGDQTVFVLWQGKVPTVVDSSKLAAGDRVVVQIRADKGSTLAQVEAAAAVRVADRKPKSGSSTTA